MTKISTFYKSDNNLALVRQIIIYKLRSYAVINDRNFATHTDNESLTEEIYAKITDYQKFLFECLNRLEAKTNFSSDDA